MSVFLSRFVAKRLLLCFGGGRLGVGESGDLMVRARTLEAVGIVSDEVARTVLDGYLRARVIRDLGHPHFHEEPASVPNPGTRRIVRLGRTIEQAWGTVTLHYISLGAQRT